MNFRSGLIRNLYDGLGFRGISEIYISKFRRLCVMCKFPVRYFGCAVMLLLLLVFPATCLAHFGVILPSDDIVQGSDSHNIVLSYQFMHPFEQNFMELVRPREAGVVVSGQRTVLTSRLKKKVMKGHTTWLLDMTVNRPGDYLFYMIPVPYWEPAEGKFIQHFTKVIVNGFGLEDGWYKPIGMKAEIVPLARPYGLWAGNVFYGQVLLNGKPAANCDVEVEYYNKKQEVKAPKEAYVTQIVRTDFRGQFWYVMPRAGWWGFAALNDGGEIVQDGRKAPVELGAVLWVRTRDMK